MKVHKLLFVFTLLICFSVQAQQDPQFTNYMYNTTAINPAYAGSRGSTSIFGLHRSQWIGLEGAPTTNVLSIHTPIENSKLGIGVNLASDKLGVTKENEASLNVSYTLDLDNRDSKLSFGVKVSANFLDVDYDRLLIYDPSDAKLSTNISNQFSPNIGAGIYYHNTNSYVGISVPTFLENIREKGNGIYSGVNQRMHIYLMGGHVFDLNPDLKFKPAMLLKAVEGAPLQADVTANFLIQEKLTLGAAYRWDAAWSALVGFQISNSLFIGYSYDGDTTKLANYNSGSHEVFLRFDLISKYKRMVSPRFF